MLVRATFVAQCLALLLVTSACGSVEDDNTAEQTPTADSDTGDLVSCAEDRAREEGVLRIATHETPEAPWFMGDPANGRGFESSVAHAVADQLGYAALAVTWLTVPEERSLESGAKNFDFDLGQLTLDDPRAQEVEFSDPYYAVPQAVVAMKGSAASGAVEMDDLDELTLGAARGSAGLAAIKRDIEPDAAPVVVADIDAAAQTLLDGDVDAVVTDFPEALQMAQETPGVRVVAQFPAAGGPQFALLLERGSALTDCVNRALGVLRQDGTLTTLEQEWLVDGTGVPVLRD